ncbi:cation channel family protein (macronuclear) [Tetrahymena thermophila SB210]|uniref:Cation channel family protein n=1 Tax=Tetrahymena thermophila (strain SB210) TaxID=312017 RepID=Q238R0_TETTS|nr:cation channel family protein [Tetrahymena thermophila SB210]EAR93160.2 cation channel family protein [Tetrahymena thermophila SB210]|eukprot:XP_001013405.2 cation channel family protein [Tetrahymena thermophila SB210]
MSKQVSNQNIVFIQSRSPTQSKLINNFVQERDTPMSGLNIDEHQQNDKNLFHTIRQFPQAQALISDHSNQHQTNEDGILESHSLAPKDILEQQKKAKLELFKQRSLMKQPTIFRNQENEEKEDQQGEEKEGISQDINLKYGDIVYFKYYREQSKGIVSGDGIAGNKIECVSVGNIIKSGSEEHFNQQQSVNGEGDDFDDIDEKQGYANQSNDPNYKRQILNKKASLQFRKCLFRVTNSKKYYYQNLYNIELKNMKSSSYKSKNQQQKLTDIEQKMREEQEENQRAYQHKMGTNVIYGQEIQLEHIYSKCIVTLNPDVLAYEHCCRELSLEEIPSQWSNFIITSSNNAKKTGEPVMYKEQISIYSSENPYYWINIQQSQSSSSDDNTEAVTDLFDEGLEVNCTDRSASMKLSLYLGVNEQKERSEQMEQQENQPIQIGDVVYIYNRIVKGRIGVARKNQSQENDSQFQMKRVELKLETNDDFKQRKGLEIQVLKVEDYTKNISSQYEFFIDTSEDEKRIETLWEIQRERNFDSSLASHDDNYRIKNIWTGLYLYLNDNDEIDLTLEGNLDKTFFSIKPKRVLQLIENTLVYQQPVKILQSLVDHTMYLRVKEDPNEEDEFNYFNQRGKQSAKKLGLMRNQCRLLEEKPKIVNTISSYNIKKDKRGEIEFEFIRADPKLINLADRVSSLFPYLMNFYIFLLHWGNRIQKNPGSNEEWYYEYFKAFEQQKYLYNYVQQLYQSIENLEDFLKPDTNLYERQRILLDAGIVEILLLTLKLIHYKIYCHCEIDNQNQFQEQKNINDKLNSIPDRTAQKIASIKLLKTISVLYDILIKCIQGNSQCSSFVLKMQKDNFLFNQIKFHKSEVVMLLKEATRYVDGDQKEQNVENMKKWVSKIQQISAANVQEQTFIIELLCLSITDHLEQPITEYQNSLRKLLFNQPRRFKDDDDDDANGNERVKFSGKQRERKYTGFLKKSHLLSFKIEQDSPYIIFNLLNSNKSKFENDNQDLYYTGKKGVVRDDENINHFPFDHINGSQVKGKTNTQLQQSIEKYEVYVLEVLNLYSLLSAGRNMKSIKCLQTLGLTKNFIYKCLQSKKIDGSHLRQYKSILNLYDSFILNVSPFTPITGYHNLVFQNIDFKDFDPKKQPSFHLFREIVVNQETKNSIRDEYQKLVDKNSLQAQENDSNLLQLYAKCIVDREEQWYRESKTNPEKRHQISSLRIQEELTIYTKEERNKIIEKLNHEISLQQNPNADKAKLSKFMMETFLQMLKIVKTRINLGYNTPEQNQRIMDIIPNIFMALIEYKEEMQNVAIQNDLTEIAAAAHKKDKRKNAAEADRFNQNWIYAFMRYNLEYSFDDLITTKIFIEAITIVNIITKLNMYLYIVEVIQSKKYFTDDSLEFFYQFKFSLEDQQKINRSNGVNLNVLIMQTLEYLKRDPILEQTMFKTLIKNFDYLKDLQNQMLEVEIIEDLQEIEIYKDVNGITENNQNSQRSPQDIKLMVFKTIQYFQFLEVLLKDKFFEIKVKDLKDEEEEKIYESKLTKINELEQSFDQLNLAIDYCISLFSKKIAVEGTKNKQQHYKLQLQNIFRHSRIPEYLLNLLDKVPQYNSVFIEFYRKLIKFFEHYTEDNMTNKRKLLDYITNIMNLCLVPNTLIATPEKLSDKIQTPIQPIKISKLCIQLLEEIKDDGTIIKDIINQIINLIEENNPFNVSKDKFSNQNWKQMKYKIYRFGVDELKCLALIQYFKILKSLTFAHNKKPIQSNQLQILNNFMHKRVLTDIVQPIIESYLTRFQIKFESQPEYLKLKLHTQGIILLAYCCKDFKIGIQEIQRFVMFDTLKAIIVSQYSPFMLKRAYLKCLFEAYVNKVYDIEKDSSNETISNIELNDILTSEIIPILSVTTSYKYLQGLIIHNEEKGQEVKGLRDNVTRNKYKIFKSNKDYEKAIWADDQKKNDDQENIQEQGIVKDVSEYWKYLFKEGVIHFVIDSFDEFSDILVGDQKDADYQGSVLSNFQFIGNYLQKLYEQIEIVEKEFKVISIQQKTYVDFELMRNVLDIIPIGNPKKSGTHFIIDKNKEEKNQVVKLNINNQEQAVENNNAGKQEINVADYVKDLEQIEVQKQFKLQLVRKRIKLQEFLYQFYTYFHDTKSITKALYLALNVQKLIFIPSQINHILKKYCNYEERYQNQLSLNSLSKKKIHSQAQDLEDQAKQVMGTLYQLATKSFKNEAVQDPVDLSIVNNIILSHKKARSQQAQIDFIKIQFSKIIKLNIKDQLNILKKSVIDQEVEKDLLQAKSNPYRLEALKGKYSQDIDNCIADYEVYVKSNDEDLKEDKSPLFNKSKTLLNNKINGISNPNPILDKSSNVARYDDLEEEEELTKVELFCLDRMMVDSQITLFLRDIQQELNIYGIDNPNEQEDEFLEELQDLEEEEKFTYQANSDINPQRRIFQSYIQLFSQVFEEKKYYLVKIVRLLLEVVQIDDLTMSQLTSTHHRERKRAKNKFDLLQLCQSEVAGQEIFIHALNLIKVTSTYDELQEGLTFMICMLNRGNQFAQNCVLNYLKKNTDSLVDFFSFLRNFFNQEITQQIKGMFDQQAISNIPTEFEILALKILRLIQLFCENVNEDFQYFLMKQIEDETTQISNYNVILEVSTFLSIFLEDDLLQMGRKQNIIIQCIDTLNECISGQQEVVDCVAQNKRLFIYLNEKIIRNNFNFAQKKIVNPTKDELRRFENYTANLKKNLELFQSAIKFILTIVSGVSKSEHLEFLLDQVQTNKLIRMIDQIYEQRIKPKEDYVQMGQVCQHLSQDNDDDDDDNGKIFCSEDFCIEGKVTLIDQLIMSIGFNVFIFFYYIRDAFPDYQDKLLAFHLDEKKDLEINLDLSDFGLSAKPQEEKIDEKKQNQQVLKNIRKQKSSRNNSIRAISNSKGQSGITNEEQDDDSEKDQNEQDEEEGPKKSQENINEEIDKFSARKLLSKGLAHQILKDIATLENNEPNDQQKDTNENIFTGKSKYQHIFDEHVDDSYLVKDKNRDYFKFFKNFVGSVEISNQHDILKKVYFQKPFYTKYLTPDIKKHLVYESDRDSDTERLMFLIDHATYYEEQMIHKQKISQWGIFSYVADKWRLYKQISYYLVVALTIITLATFGYTEETDNDVANSSNNENIKNTFVVVSYIQLILSFAILVSCAIERFPISVYRNVESQVYETIQRHKKNAGFPDDSISSVYNLIANKLYNVLSIKNAKSSLYVKILLVCFDKENIYNLCYLIITGFAFSNNLIYAFLLLDIVKRSEDLQNVISSITKNALSLLKFSFLGLVIMYIYGIIGNQSFKGDYQPENGTIGDTFILTITSTIKQGLKNGGGIAESLRSVDYDEHTFWSRYFFDLTFFIVINMLFIQMIFGIILDTFGELRDNRQELLALVTDTCYICGLSRRFVEANSDEDWYHHIYMEHNCYNLLFYIIYIRRKSENDCDALEKYIKKCLDRSEGENKLQLKPVDFTPIGKSLSIQNFRSKEKDHNESEEHDNEAHNESSENGKKQSEKKD